jgi:hypothetical protein
MANFTEPGKWYLVVSCAGCGKAIPFAETVSPDEQPDLQYRTIGNLTCPQCGHVDTYAPALMSRQPGPETGEKADDCECPAKFVPKGRYLKLVTLVA